MVGVHYNEIGFRLARFQAAFIKSVIPSFSFLRFTFLSIFPACSLPTSPFSFFFLSLLFSTLFAIKKRTEGKVSWSFDLSLIPGSSSRGSWPDLQWEFVLYLPAFRLFSPADCRRNDATSGAANIRFEPRDCAWLAIFMIFRALLAERQKEEI